MFACRILWSCTDFSDCRCTFRCRLAGSLPQPLTSARSFFLCRNWHPSFAGMPFGNVQAGGNSWALATPWTQIPHNTCWLPALDAAPVAPLSTGHMTHAIIQLVPSTATLPFKPSLHNVGLLPPVMQAMPRYAAGKITACRSLSVASSSLI